jgi:YesN/AraC family two-component response regulator
MNYSILYIEDEKMLRENYALFLKVYFERVYTAVDGEDGYEKYQQHKPDILLIDINLPKLNGIELLKKIRAQDNMTKAIILTGNSKIDFLLSATSLKLTRYLLKPVEKELFVEALDAVKKELAS